MKEIIIGYNKHEPGSPDPLCIAWEQTGILVRCKDCKYSVDSGEKNILGDPLLVCIVGGVYSEQRLKYPEGFCDDGKRKD